jgi:hypothetical protein
MRKKQLILTTIKFFTVYRTINIIYSHKYLLALDVNEQPAVHKN